MVHLKIVPLAVEPRDKKWRLEWMETKPVNSKLLIKKTDPKIIEAWPWGLVLGHVTWVSLQELKLQKQAHVCFLCCRKQSPTLTTVQSVSKGTSPATWSGSCPAGKSPGCLFWLGQGGKCLLASGSDLLGPSAQVFPCVTIKQPKAYSFCVTFLLILFAPKEVYL